jgi:hypothetical protein
VSTVEHKEKLLSEMDTLMRSLRKCDSQATAIEWMTRAYNAMDGATRLVRDLERMVEEESAQTRGLVLLREKSSQQRGLIFQIPKPRLEIVQTIPPVIAHRVIEDKKPNYQRTGGETVVYPEFFLHPGLKKPARAWTREDTLRLEAAQKMGPHRIVKRGR